jgi:hypothetical protein
MKVIDRFQYIFLIILGHFGQTGVISKLNLEDWCMTANVFTASKKMYLPLEHSGANMNH